MIVRPARRLLVAAIVLVLAGCAKKLDSSSVVLEPIDAKNLVLLVREPGAAATLVNVWASWCQPCREEFPDLVRLEREWRDKGFRLVFVSADFPEDVPKARAFLAEQGVSARTFLKTGDDMQFIDTLDPRWTGALPGSFLYDSSGRLVRFWEGKASGDSLRARILPLLDAPRT